MRIVRITVWRVALPFHKPYVYSGGRRTLHQLDAVLVRLETDAGLTGWGEGCPFGPTYAAAFAGGIEAGLAELAPELIGRDPCGIDAINRQMDERLPGHPYIKTALDMACWDLFGQAAEVPLATLLGGRTQEPVQLQSSLSTGAPEAMAADVQAARARGYRVHSSKLGGGDPAADIARVRAVAGSLQAGDSVTFDANGAWLPDTAMLVMNAVRDLPVYFEQPCASYEECRTVRGATVHPIILDESIDSLADVVRAHREGACELVGLKIGRVGGLTKARRIRDFCVEFGLRLNIEDTGSGGLGDAAAVHLAHATPRRQRRATVLYTEMVAGYLAPGQGVVNDGGYTAAPTALGLGVAPCADALGPPVATYAG